MTKRKLYLTSGGLPPANTPDFLDFYQQDPLGKTVAFIPTAADPETDKSFVDESRQELLALGFKVEDVNLKDYTPKNLLPKLQSFDVIYVNGGNTFYLLYWVRQSGLDQVIDQLLTEGKLYIGTSAGSILAGQTIASSAWKGWDDPEIVKLDNWDGLKLVDFDIFVHYEPKYLPIVEQNLSKIPGKLIGLTNQQAIAVTDSDYKIVGPGERLEYN